MIERSIVPCNGCTACCKHERVILYPEDGDIVESYETIPATLKVPGNRRMLAHKPNGDCWYLGENGCTIWDRAPATCKEFDCRFWYLKFNRQQRKELLAKDILNKEIFKAARARVNK